MVDAPSSRTSDWIPFARFAKAHGLRGELRVVPLHAGDPWPESLEDIQVSFKDQSCTTFRVTSVRNTHDAFLVMLEGVDDRDKAKALSGAFIAIRREDRPELDDGEFYLADLVGLLAVDEEGERIGDIVSVMDNTGQDLLEIRTARGNRMVPMTEDTLLELDWDSQRVTLQLIPGLLD